MKRPVQPAGLDLGTLALFAGQACAAAVQRDLARRGFGDVRFSHGFVFQHLVEDGRSVTELARRMGVTQQAASKVVGELARLGYVKLAADEGDARRRSVRLTRRGRAVIAAARLLRRIQEGKLARRHGARRVAASKELLAEVLEGLGGAAAVRERRVPSPD